MTTKSLPEMRQKQFIVKYIFLLINVPTQYLNQFLNPFFLNIILPEHINNLLHRNVLIVITCNQPKRVSDIPQIVFAVCHLERIHELLEVDFLVNIEHFCGKLAEMGGRYIVTYPLEYVLQVFAIDLALFCVHVEDLEECLALGSLQLKLMRGYLLHLVR